MENLSEIVDSLEEKINLLLEKHNTLKEINLKLNEELAVEKLSHRQSLEELNHWKENIESLKLANAMLGSENFKRETKLKINSLIREIDSCIAQLSE